MAVRVYLYLQPVSLARNEELDGRFFAHVRIREPGAQRGICRGFALLPRGEEAS
jgi:hypothetical protein